LGQLGDSRAIEPLAAAITNKDIGEFAARALLQLGDSSALDRLLSDMRNCPPHSACARINCKVILEYGAKNREHLVALLEDRLKSHRDRYTAELLVRLNAPFVKKYLPAVILDWLEFTRGTGVHEDGWLVHEDDGLKLMATWAGMDSEALTLAAAALGNTYKTEHGRSSGGNFSWSRVGSHDTTSVTKLCQRQDIWSSCILYRVAKKKDVTVTMTSCGPVGNYEVKLSFEEERQAARLELVRRGFGDTDPLTSL
jgi:hypothetical protein